MKRQLGFTLIELIIVVVLLGILAATALPKFADLTTQAKTAANRGTGGAIIAAIHIVHASWLAKGNTNTAATITLIEGTINTINTNNAGWASCAGGATACTAGPVAVADCAAVWNNILTNPPTLTAGASCVGNGCYFATLTGTGATAVCQYNLGPGSATTYNIRYTPSSGQVAITP